MKDLTIIFLTANVIDKCSMNFALEHLYKSIGDTEIVSVSFKPIDVGTNIVIGERKKCPRTIYKQLLIGAQEAKTKYIAVAEDKILYNKTHFRMRPKDNHIAYNVCRWTIFNHAKIPYYSWTERIVNSHMIADRQTLINTLTERYLKYSDDENYPIRHWCEPGKRERSLRITPVQKQILWSKIPTVGFYHNKSICYQGMGDRKRQGFLKAEKIPYWGNSIDLVNKWNGE